MNSPLLNYIFFRKAVKNVAPELRPIDATTLTIIATGKYNSTFKIANASNALKTSFKEWNLPVQLNTVQICVQRLAKLDLIERDRNEFKPFKKREFFTHNITMNGIVLLNAIENEVTRCINDTWDAQLSIEKLIKRNKKVNTYHFALAVNKFNAKKEKPKEAKKRNGSRIEPGAYRSTWGKEIGKNVTIECTGRPVGRPKGSTKDTLKPKQSID